jgi:L-iditol 2-dehydrogenase
MKDLTFEGQIFECGGIDKFQIKNNLWKMSSEKVLLKPISVGICASDFSRFFEGTAHTYPLTAGHEIYAEVVDNNTSLDFQRGERVSVFPLIPCRECMNCKKLDFNLCKSYSYLGSREPGGLASYLAVSPWNLKRISRTLPNRLGNQIEPLSVVNHAFGRFNSLTTDSRLVFSGSGFLTYLGIQVALSRGISNISVVTNNKWGTDFFSRYCRIVTPNELTSINFECYIDFSGNFEIFDRATDAISENAEMILVANRRADTYISSHSWNKILRKEIMVKGSWNSTFLGPYEEDDWSTSISQLIDSEIPDDYPHLEITLTDLPKYLESKIARDRNRDSIEKFRLSINVD